MKEKKYNLMTVKQICEKHSWLPYGGLRWLIFNKNKNGLEKCVYKIGRRVLIDEYGFQDWVESHRQSQIVT